MAAFRVQERVVEQVAAGYEARVEHLGQRVCGQHVAVAADDHGGLVGPAIEQAPKGGRDLFGFGPGRRRRRRGCGLREPVQVGQGLLVQAERSADRVEDLR